VTLRVRALQLERMVERMELRQRLVGSGLGAAVLWLIGQSTPVVRLGALALAVDAWRARSAMVRLETQRKRFANEDPGKYDDVDFYTGLTGEDVPSADGCTEA